MGKNIKSIFTDLQFAVEKTTRQS